MIANKLAMLRGGEAVWSKALTYITVENYRGVIREHLARDRFWLAILDEGMKRREAVAKLRLARSTNPDVVNQIAFALGCFLVTLPGLRRFARLRWLGAFRCWGLHWLGLRPNRSPQPNRINDES